MTAERIEALVDEFRALGFGETDARRSAFTAISWVAGWNAARVGRYLGVSRARVGQRIDKLQELKDDPDMPLLRRVMSGNRQPEPNWLAATSHVGFPASNWEDEDFSGGILNLLSSDQRQAA